MTNVESFMSEARAELLGPGNADYRTREPHFRVANETPTTLIVTKTRAGTLADAHPGNSVFIGEYFQTRRLSPNRWRLILRTSLLLDD